MLAACTFSDVLSRLRTDCCTAFACPGGGIRRSGGTVSYEVIGALSTRE